jgi:hypothetical protein
VTKAAFLAGSAWCMVGARRRGTAKLRQPAANS